MFGFLLTKYLGTCIIYVNIRSERVVDVYGKNI